MFFTALSRCPMRCKSGRTYVRHKIFKMDRPKPKSEKSETLFARQIISKNQVNRINICTGMNERFSKVLTTFCKEVRENSQYNFCEKTLGSLRITKYNIFTQKVKIF